MDTIGTYIKMCTKAGEIQEQWKHSGGDFCYVKERFPLDEWVRGVEYPDRFKDCWLDIGVHIIGEGHYWAYEDWGCLGAEDEHYKYLIWLPRQDQLQAMITTSTPKLLSEFYLAWIEWLKIDSEIVGYCNSLEQLWLAFMMKELYSKVWTGTEWKNEHRCKQRI